MKRRYKTHRTLRSAVKTGRSGIRLVRQRIRQAPLIAILLVFLLGVWGGAVLYSHVHPAAIDPGAYKPLLETIAKGESNGNYNAHYGSAGNTAVRFTDMTIAEVLQWQEEFVRQGHPSNAVGKYQIIRPTLAGLVNRLGLDPQAKFDEAMQDRLAIALLERRGSKAFIAKDLSRKQFAANLAQEWAALPAASGPNPEKSYYAGDGLNQARVSVDELYAALTLFEQQATTHQE